MEKSADAYRTISEAADEVKLPQHVLRFWETRFPQLKPLKRGGGRRFYRPEDKDLLLAIKTLLYGDGYTIKGVQRILREQGPRAVASLAQSGAGSIRGAKGSAAKAEQDLGRASTDMPRLSGPGDVMPRVQEGTPEAAGERAALPDPRRLDGAQASRPGSLPDAAVARLRTVLFELSECDRILVAARS